MFFLAGTISLHSLSGSPCATAPPGALTAATVATPTPAQLWFVVDDIHRAVATVRELGGTATDPVEYDSGWASDCTDDQGMEVLFVAGLAIGAFLLIVGVVNVLLEPSLTPEEEEELLLEEDLHARRPFSITTAIAAICPST